MDAFSVLIMAQFWSKVRVVREDTACWVWIGAFDSSGYGMFKMNGRDNRAHRIAYEMVHGPAGKEPVLHRCDNPACCNPFHLRTGSQAQNMQDMATKGRQRRLLPKAVRDAILRDCGPSREVALRHGVSTKTVAKLRQHVTRDGAGNRDRTGIPTLGG